MGARLTVRDDQYGGMTIPVYRPRGIVDNAALTDLGDNVAERYIGSSLAYFVCDLRGLELAYDLEGILGYLSKLTNAGITHIIVAPVVGGSTYGIMMKLVSASADFVGVGYTGKVTHDIETALAFVADSFGRLSPVN